MAHIKLKSLFPDLDFLSSRENGLKLRNLALDELNSNAIVEFDFSGFEVVTQSFTDEFIGVVVRERGLDFLKNHFKVSNAASEIRSMLNLVVSYSSSKINSEAHA